MERLVQHLPRPRAPRASVALLGLLVACSHPASDPLERATRGISRDRIHADGKLLSTESMAGRYYASPEADSSAAFLLQRLSALGAPPVQRAEGLLGSRPASFTHHFTVTLYRLGPHNRLSWQRGGRERAAELGHDFLPLVFAREAEIAGVAFWLREPIEALRPAQRAAVRGRVVLVDTAALGATRDESRGALLYRVAHRLEELGATAVLFSGDVDLLHEDAATFPSSLPRGLQTAAQSARGALFNLHPDRLSLAAQAQAWREAPRRTLPALVVRSAWTNRVQPGDDLGLSVDLEAEVSFGENVLVGFRGLSRPDEVVVVGASYDAGGVNAAGQVLNGADDNASGVAALLEIAGALSQVQAQLQRSVVLSFFYASTAGLLGSEMLLDDLPRLFGPAPHPVAMLALRAVGRNGRRPLLVFGANENAALADVLQRLDRRDVLLGPPLVLQRLADAAPRRGATALDPAASRSSDHLTFARAGVPSLLLNDGLDPELYGHPDDDWKYVNPEEVARVARLAFRFAYALASDVTAEARPASTRP